jgi:hypothetical protein
MLWLGLMLAGVANAVPGLGRGQGGVRLVAHR